VIADRTAYDKQYTGKPSNLFQLQVYIRTAGTHNPTQRVECMNSPKRNPLKRDWPKVHEVSEFIAERNTTSERLIVCLKKLTFAFSSTRFFVVHFVAKRYILQQKCMKGQIGTCLPGTVFLAGKFLFVPSDTWNTTFSTVGTDPENHSAQRDRRTDRRTTTWWRQLPIILDLAWRYILLVVHRREKAEVKSTNVKNNYTQTTNAIKI